MIYSLTTQLAILQQAEYDLKLWEKWLKIKRDPQIVTRLQKIQPAKRTWKWRYLKLSAGLMSLVIPTTWAITLALRVWRILENLIRVLLVFLARIKLRRLQMNQLQVVVVAGSYGKTSVKHLVTHFLSHHEATLMTPVSYNTPLGIALTILKQLKKEHRFFVVELGEYQVGDLEPLLAWLHPHTGILTPIGLNHSERWEQPTDQIDIFSPLWEHPQAPQNLLVDDINQELLPQHLPHVTFYGDHESSDFTINKIKLTITESSATLIHEKQALAFHTRLLGRGHLRNTVAAIALGNQLGLGSIWEISRYAAYAPDIPRRIQVIPTTASLLIDNSYNTSPGSWLETKYLLAKLKLSHLAIVTGGFVELDQHYNQSAHQKMANDLQEVADLVIVIKSRYNKDLIKTLQQHDQNFLVVNSLDEALVKLSQQQQQIDYLWLEGGMREIYQ